MTKKQRLKFFSKTRILENGCIVFKPKCFRFGLPSYGSIFGKSAHRVSWEIFYGKIPNGVWVLHKCDNPPCVNPEHLWIGTASDNNSDTYKKGRNPGGYKSGSKHLMAKLTEEQVLEIRSKYVPFKYTVPMLSKEYGLPHPTIRHIVRKSSWKHI